MDPDILKQLATGGIAAALLVLIYVVGMRLVTALDKLGAKLDDHTKVDVEHHTKVEVALARLDERRNTPAFGIGIRQDTNGGP